jgi:hypothetical protein
MAHRHIVIGDVHGCLPHLRALLAKLSYEAPTDRLVFLGDIIDQGPMSVETLRFVKALTIHDGAVCLLGNHERECLMRLGLLEPQPLPWDGGRPIFKDNPDIADSLSPSDLAWLLTLPYYHRFPGHVAVHAGVCPMAHDCCWNDPYDEGHAAIFTAIRYVDESGRPVASNESVSPRLWAELYDGRFGRVIFGHHPYAGEEAARIFPHACGIDTGCWFTGRLTAMVVVAGRGPEFVSSDESDLPSLGQALFSPDHQSSPAGYGVEEVALPRIRMPLAINGMDFGGRTWDDDLLESRLSLALYSCYGQPGISRKLAKGLGQLGDCRAVPALVAGLGDARAKVRSAAAWALWRMADGECGEDIMPALEKLLEAVSDDASPAVRLCAAAALGRLILAPNGNHAERIVAALSECLWDASHWVRDEVFIHLVMNELSFKEITRAMAARGMAAPEVATETLAYLIEAFGLGQVILLESDDDDGIRRLAAAIRSELDASRAMAELSLEPWERRGEILAVVRRALARSGCESREWGKSAAAD